jgi:tRNA pseudouridine38-40 synthase
MPTIRLDLEYDGTDFHGWQVQPATRTVQGVLEAALHDILHHPVRLTGAGRTDTGVHALGQVASFRSDHVPPAPQLLRRLNVGIPPDVRVLAVREVEDGFSARHSARARRYRYQMLRRRSALWTRYYHVLRWPVDVDAMSEAASSLLGEQDFTAFANARAGDNCRCLVSRATVQGDVERIWFDITANRFMHNMVRRLSGVLVEVGRGRLRPSQVRDILLRRDRSRGGPCLPAAGLFFVSVDYSNSAISAPGAGVDVDGANP